MATGQEITKGTAPVRFRCTVCGGWVLPKENQTPMLRAACPCGGARVVGTAEAVDKRDSPLCGRALSMRGHGYVTCVRPYGHGGPCA